MCGSVDKSRVEWSRVEWSGEESGVQRTKRSSAEQIRVVGSKVKKNIVKKRVVE